MEVLNLQDGAVGRDELARYLADFETEDRYSFDDWRIRLRFYWDLNPVHDPKGPTGWALVEKGRIRGFLGAIQTRFHNSRGEFGKGLSATTWRVDSDARSQSMLLFMKYMQAKKDHILTDTTPTPDVEKILSAFKFLGPYVSNNFLVPVGQRALGRGLMKCITPASWVPPRGEWIGREALARLRVDFKCPDGYFQRFVDRALLDWYVFEGIREKCLFGVIEGDRLIGYAVFLKEIFRGVPLLRAVDFQFRPEAQAFLPGLVARVAEEAGSRYGVRFVVWTTFATHPEHSQAAIRALNKTKADQHHYYFKAPALWPDLKWAPKMFDGDYGC